MIYYFIAFDMGLAIALQAPINSALGKGLGSWALMPAFISFFIGTLLLATLVAFSGGFNAGFFKALTQQSLWKFLGGALGAFFVFGTILLADKIGLINMFITVLFAQLIMSLSLDGLGAFELVKKEISWQKILGLCVIFTGLLIFFSKELLRDKI